MKKGDLISIWQLVKDSKFGKMSSEGKTKYVKMIAKLSPVVKEFETYRETIAEKLMSEHENFKENLQDAQVYEAYQQDNTKDKPKMTDKQYKEFTKVVEKYNKDFFAGYSPERINPGDKVHTVEFIKKITSGSTPEVADIIDNVYNSVLKNGTHKAPSMKVAEAAKVIENSERDIMIAFFNELSKIFTLMGIDTTDVVEAAGTKWNFIKMNPGLVGGHCISVDPYYLAQCAQRLGYNPEIILAGRRMNDGMGEYVATETIKLMLKKGIQVLNSNIIILGFTFKENCPDVRNTKVIDIYKALKEYNVNITVYDPWANPAIVEHEYGIRVVNELPTEKFDAAIAAVAHKKFDGLDVSALLKEKHVIFDVKCTLDRSIIDGRL